MAPAFKRKSVKSDDASGASEVEDGRHGGSSRPVKKGKSSGSDFKPSAVARTDANGDRYLELSRARRVTINEFRGKALVNIREYYEKDGEFLPGKKGISLSVDQYAALVSLLPQIEAILADKGEKVPRPDYGGADQPDQDEGAGSGTGNGETAGADSDAEARRANIEATSDEDE